MNNISKATTGTATIKFFKSSSSISSDSDDSDVEESAVPKANSKRVNGTDEGVSLKTSAPCTARPAIAHSVGANNDHTTIAQNEHVAPSSSPFNPFNDTSSDDSNSDSDLKVFNSEDSIYDTPTMSKDFNFSGSSRRRTDSDSNYFDVEEEAGEPLVLNMMDDHFGHPEDLNRLKEVNGEIEKVKQLIYTTPDENVTEKGQLIDRLISLRMRKGELENPVSTDMASTVKTVYGHELHVKESSSEMERYCEVCTAVVWGVIQVWYTCVHCHVCCHEKCLNALKRMCASRRVKDSPAYIMSICKEKGLASQNYKCFECQTPISYKTGAVEPRQCDYTGSYYCPLCHWNDEVIIPARVIHNWDFEPRKVCRASKQYLRLMYNKPVICIETSNHYLLNFVEELSEMKKLRTEILLMKTYFLSCQSAMQSKILLLLGDRQHFVENIDYYTMHDIVELANERLLPVIVNIHAKFAAHIKLDCATCRGKGFYCEICRRPEIIFPFDNVCILCKECSNVFHKYCFNKLNQNCPKCDRIRRRQNEGKRKAELLRQIEEANSS